MGLSEEYIIKSYEANSNIHNIPTHSSKIDNIKHIDSNKQIQIIKITVCLTSHEQCSGEYRYNDSLKLNTSIVNNDFIIICLCNCHNIKYNEVSKK